MFNICNFFLLIFILLLQIKQINSYLKNGRNETELDEFRTLFSKKLKLILHNWDEDVKLSKFFAEFTKNLQKECQLRQERETVAKEWIWLGNSEALFIFGRIFVKEIKAQLLPKLEKKVMWHALKVAKQRMAFMLIGVLAMMGRQWIKKTELRVKWKLKENEIEELNAGLGRREKLEETKNERIERFTPAEQLLNIVDSVEFIVDKMCEELSELAEALHKRRNDTGNKHYPTVIAENFQSLVLLSEYLQMNIPAKDGKEIDWTMGELREFVLEGNLEESAGEVRRHFGWVGGMEGTKKAVNEEMKLKEGGEIKKYMKKVKRKLIGGKGEKKHKQQVGIIETILEEDTSSEEEK